MALKYRVQKSKLHAAFAENYMTNNDTYFVRYNDRHAMSTPNFYGALIVPSEVEQFFIVDFLTSLTNE